MKKVGFFIGCNIAFNRPDNEQAIRFALPALGVEIVELEGQTCCPAFGTMPSVDMVGWVAASGWNLIIAEEKGVDIFTACGSCYGSLSESYHNMHVNPELKARANELFKAIGKEYKGTSKVRSSINYLYNEIGIDKIKESIKYKLEGMKVAVQPGCHNLWPSKAYYETEEDTFHPKRLRELCEALGASAPAYSRLTDCCGMGALRSVAPEKSFGLLKIKLANIKEEVDPDLIVVGCNSCLMQLDAGQQMLYDKKEIEHLIPALHIMQLLALCLGADPQKVTGLSTQNLDKVISRIIGG